MEYRKKINFSRHDFILIIILSAFIIFVLLNIEKAYSADEREKTYEELISAGLILDHTITPIGQRFYKDFMSHWKAPSGIDQFTAEIVERFNPQWGSIAWITIDNNMVFRHSLSTRNMVMDEVAQQAVKICQQYLFKREILRKFQKSSDLYGDGY